MNSNLDEYHWFNMNNRNWRNNGVNIEWNDESDWDDSIPGMQIVEYIMTEHGLERTHRNILERL